jgi:hypothetical protein
MAARRTAPFIGMAPMKDAKIQFKAETFGISSRIFAAFSARFVAELRMTELSPFVIDKDVSSESVREFIRACQFEEYDISKCNLIEFEYLSEKWEVEVIATEVKKIISSASNQKSIVIDRLLFKLDRNEQTSEIESEVRNVPGGVFLRAQSDMDCNPSQLETFCARR